MKSQIPPQATFFYRGKWNREMDTYLLSTLIGMRNGRDWEDANLPAEVLRNVQALINAPFGTDLTTEDIAVRVIELKGRYIAFKKVVATTGANWKMEDKFVHADDSTWKLIFQRDPAAGAYYHRDEPEFCLLASLFGLSDVKAEFPREVITLSDSTEVIVLTETVEPNVPVHVSTYQSPSDSDEVNSPMPGPSTRVRSTRVRCKLFDVGAPCFDGTTSYKSPNRYSPANKDVLTSPKASSCASWSPCPPSRKPAP